MNGVLSINNQINMSFNMKVDNTNEDMYIFQVKIIEFMIFFYIFVDITRWKVNIYIKL